jgi:hypothetical protein
MAVALSVAVVVGPNAAFAQQTEAPVEPTDPTKPTELNVKVQESTGDPDGFVAKMRSTQWRR